MRQNHYWNLFAFSQMLLVEGKIVPAVLLPHEENRHNLLAFPKHKKAVSMLPLEA